MGCALRAAIARSSSTLPRPVARLTDAGSVDDVVDIVHAEFQTWFDGAAGPRDRYVPVATELWEAVQRG